MANKGIFSSKGKGFMPSKRPDTTNKAGGSAYSLPAKHALAQMVATGCLNQTYYVGGQEQVDRIVELAGQVEPEFVAKLAVYARRAAYMKDTPALLVAWLAAKSHVGLFRRTFARVIDNGKMLRNFVQIMRSGALGRRSLGSAPKDMVNQWLANRTDEQVFRASVGNDPSLADVIKMTHPRPSSKAREAMYGYLLGREHSERSLPAIVREYEAFKAGRSKKVPDVDFQMLTALNIGEDGWVKICKDASWQMTRMNLNTFARHKVFDDKAMVRVVAERLADAEEIKKARCFPYQLMCAYKNVNEAVPRAVREALHDAMEVAIDNVPEIDGKVYVFPDVSGSMSSPVTGYRQGSTTSVQCRDVAALVAAAFLRRNGDAEVIPFSDRTYDAKLSRRDSVLTNAEKLARLPSGGTDCSLPIELLNRQGAEGDLLVYVSDNESWIHSNRRQTEAVKQWRKFKERNPKAKMVCIDITPNETTQAPDDKSVLNVGGFSDAVFDVAMQFSKYGNDAEHWVGLIEDVSIDGEKSRKGKKEDDDE